MQSASPRVTATFIVLLVLVVGFLLILFAPARANVLLDYTSTRFMSSARVAAPLTTASGLLLPGAEFGRLPAARDCDSSALGERELTHPGSRPYIYESYTTWYHSLVSNANPKQKLIGLEVGALFNKADFGTASGFLKMHYVDALPFEELAKLWKEAYPDKNVSSDLQAPEFTTDAQTLAGVKDGFADIFVSSHVIEHTRSALTALENSLRVLKPGGLFFLTVPNMCRTFDRQRVLTKWEHFLEEYQDNSGGICDEHETEHYREWALVKLANAERKKYVLDGAQHRLDPSAAAIEEAVEAVRAKNESIHYHTWTPFSLFHFLERARMELGFPLKVLSYMSQGISLIVVIERSS